MQSGVAKSASYTLVVRGELDDRFVYLFNGMTMQKQAGTTVLSGTVIDQSQLHGHIARIQELGLELLSIKQTSGPSDASIERGESDH